MKIKLFFILLIVLFGSCARKTIQAGDYDYYKREIAKSKRLEQEKAKAKSIAEKPNIVSKEPRYLTPEQKTKFAKMLGVDETAIKNEKLYAAIDDWMGTPYTWGGISKTGVDCSSYVQQMYQKVYSKELPRTSLQQFYFDTKSQFRDQQYLREGDLIFFRLRYQDEVVSHVGIYLQNGKFTGSNSPRGVEIADLNSDYWQDKYVACARLLTQPKTK